MTFRFSKKRGGLLHESQFDFSIMDRFITYIFIKINFIVEKDSVLKSFYLVLEN